MLCLEEGNRHPSLPIQRHCPQLPCLAQVHHLRQSYSIQSLKELWANPINPRNITMFPTPSLHIWLCHTCQVSTWSNSSPGGDQLTALLPPSPANLTIWLQNPSALQPRSSWCHVHLRIPLSLSMLFIISTEIHWQNMAQVQIVQVIPPSYSL